jgi:predicted CXXCH cytochrome family protein
VDRFLKKLLLLVLATVFLLALTTEAFANTGTKSGGYLPYSTTLNAFVAPDGTVIADASASPHGGYTDATGKCKTCHAVHGAAPGGEVLLRTTKADACVYCHVSGAFAIAQPYGSDPASYQNELDNNHASTHQGTAYGGCASCHSVHGANVWSNASDGVDIGMILRNDPGATIGAGNNQGAIREPVTTLTDFCRDCHDGTALAQPSYQAVDGTTCARDCHAPQMLVTNTGGRNGVSHIMTTTLTGTGTDASGNAVQVANAVSTDCRSCHKGAAVYADGNSFPHITPGADFLTDSYRAVSGLDRVCLECHQWTSGSTAMGVGNSF